MSNNSVNLIVVCGPTASGKTRLAVTIALRYNGEIVSADSRQVYRGMDIGTGKDLNEYLAGDRPVPYHCIDIADPAQTYSLYYYQRDCYAAIRKIWERKRMPVMAGGSGLYIEAVVNKYRIPMVPENESFRCSLMKKEKQELRAQLESTAPALYASTDISSKKRIVRALEIACYNEKPPAPAQVFDPLPDIRPLILCIRLPREALKERIRSRLVERIENGMIEEVEKLRRTGLSRTRCDRLGLEYAHIARYLDNEVSRDTMVDALYRDILRFAKRQMTYFRGMERRGVPVHWIEGPDEAAAAAVFEAAHCFRQ